MRESRRAGARLAIALLTAALATLLAAQAAAAAPGGGTRLPSRYVIPNVPLWQQQQALGCGAASAQMVMDYWGPFIDQREVYNAARTWQGTAGRRSGEGRPVQRPELARGRQLPERGGLGLHRASPGLTLASSTGSRPPGSTSSRPSSPKATP